MDRSKAGRRRVNTKNDLLEVRFGVADEGCATRRTLVQGVEAACSGPVCVGQAVGRTVNRVCAWAA